MSDKLKPCPFCGSEGGVAIDVSSWVTCRECGAEGPVAEPGAADCRGQAAALWNKRA